MSLRHRPYRASDRDVCISIFRSNVPQFFRDHELADFTEFLDTSDCSYFVVFAGNAVVGCGGFGLENGSDAADLCWGMVHRGQQGKEIGAYLLFARLHAIITTSDAQQVRLGTSQHTEGFFHRYGFEIQSSKANGIAEGLDYVEMKIDLTDTNRNSIKHNWRKIVGQRTVERTS